VQKEGDDDPEWTRLERVVLPLICHGDRGVLAHARVVRVNEGKPGDTWNVVLNGFPGGSDVLIDKLATTPQVGDVLQVLLDPENPGVATRTRFGPTSR
jgi:hypothetical protein